MELPAPPTLAELADFLDGALCGAGGAASYPGDQNGVYLPSACPVRRLGLALEAWPDLAEQAEARKLDALFLHRPWGLTAGQTARLETAGIGALACHLAFDERLTTGFNPRLAEALGLESLETLGEKAGRPLGMIGDLRVPVNFREAVRRLSQILGGCEQAAPPPLPDQPFGRVAVVGAMTDALVREAHARGVGLYVTGQWRQPAREAVRETSLGILCTGHERMERWGLRALAGMLTERWASLETVVLRHAETS